MGRSIAAQTGPGRRVKGRSGISALRPYALKLIRGGAAVDSLPRSKSDLSDFNHFGWRSRVDPTSRGGGLGRGVVPRGTEVQHLATPTPNPSPQGGGEQFARPSRITLALMGRHPAAAAAIDRRF